MVHFEAYVFGQFLGFSFLSIPCLFGEVRVLEWDLTAVGCRSPMVPAEPPVLTGFVCLCKHVCRPYSAEDITFGPKTVP